MISLYDKASETHSRHPTTKPLSYYKKYDDFLKHHNIVPKAILEIGTFEGESTKILSEVFPESKILSVDIQLRPIDFSKCKNVTYKQADQTNRDQLVPLITDHFPKGIDLVIEDASHFGYFS